MLINILFGIILIALFYNLIRIVYCFIFPSKGTIIKQEFEPVLVARAETLMALDDAAFQQAQKDHRIEEVALTAATFGRERRRNIQEAV